MITRDRTIILAEILGATFSDGFERQKQHCCEIVVSYDKGGTNYFTGQRIARGYLLSVRHYTIDCPRGHFRTIVMDGRSNPASFLMESARFSDATLRKLALAVVEGSGEMRTMLGRLYQSLQAVRPEGQFPDIASDDAWAAVLSPSGAAVAG